MTEGVGVAEGAICSSIRGSLESGKRVLWLVSGGSCVGPQVKIMEKLRETLPDALSLLTVLPVDERYGEYGHQDSNSQQMRQAGFSPGSAAWIDVLSEHLPMPETVERYSQLASEAFASADVVTATLGMGADAHTAGILPGSPAVTDTVSTALGYTWSDYERMTLGIPMLLNINRVWLLAYGEGKKEALKRLQHNEEPIEKLPAKILYDIADVTVYNDYIQTEEMA